jgi:hypothetical protein
MRRYWRMIAIFPGVGTDLQSLYRLRSVLVKPARDRLQGQQPGAEPADIGIFPQQTGSKSR